MREELLESTEGMRIAKTRSECTCAYDGSAIDHGDHGLLFRMADSREEYDDVYTVWVSLENRTQLKQDLMDFDFEEIEPREEISPSGSISYSNVKGKSISCLACGESMDKGEEGVVFVNHRDNSRGSTAWCHTECVSTVCEGLDTVNEYAMDVVMEVI